MLSKEYYKTLKKIQNQYDMGLDWQDKVFKYSLKNELYDLKESEFQLELLVCGCY